MLRDVSFRWLFENVPVTNGRMRIFGRASKKGMPRKLFLALLALQGCLALTRISAQQSNSETDFAGYPPDIASILRKGELVMCLVKTDEPPFFMTNAAGELSGSAVALGRAIARKMGVRAVFKRNASTYNQVIDEVFKHQADIGMGFLSITPERALRVRFTDDYYQFHPSLFVNRIEMAQRGWQLDTLSELSHCGPDIRIGVLRDSASGSQMKQNFPNATLVDYDRWQNLLQDVANGKLFAAATPPSSLHQWMEGNPSAILRGVEVVDTLQTELIGIAVAWDHDNLRNFMNVYIRELKNNGTIEKWRAEYGLK
jgi:ABC-type amino acid transport substrate-binding protein